MLKIVLKLICVLDKISISLQAGSLFFQGLLRGVKRPCAVYVSAALYKLAKLHYITLEAKYLKNVWSVLDFVQRSR